MGSVLAKREDLRKYKSETELTLMATLKKALDPENLLNPRKGNLTTSSHCIHRRGAKLWGFRERILP